MRGELYRPGCAVVTVVRRELSRLSLAETGERAVVVEAMAREMAFEISARLVENTPMLDLEDETLP